MKGCRPLTEEEVNRVIMAFKGRYQSRDKALFVLGIKTGFRISEILSLRLSDVLKGGEFLQRISVKRQNTKGKFEGRSVIVHPEAHMALKAWVICLFSSGDMNIDDYIFQSRKGKNRPITRNHAWSILKDAFMNAGLKGNLGTHSMRKSYCSRVYENLNHDLFLTQKAMGHRNINSTIRYLSFAQEDIDKAILAS